MPVLKLSEISRLTSSDDAEHISLVFGGRKTTARELDDRVNQVANGLIALGVVPQERVAILDLNSDQFYELWLGTSRAAAVLVPLNSRVSAKEAAQILADCRPRVLFIGSMYLEMLEAIRSELPSLEHVIVTGEQYASWRDAQSDLEHAPDTTEKDVCLQIYTSGTTGASKGVQITSENLFKTAMGAFATGEPHPCRTIGSSDAALLCMPHGHIAASILGVLGLARGTRLVIVNQFIPLEIAALIDREQITFTILVPVMVRALISALDSSGTSCQSLRNIVYGAAPMPSSLLKVAMARLPHVDFGQIYGLTETAGPISYLSPEDHRTIARGDTELALSCGRATAGVELGIVGDDGLPLDAGEVGEIICRSEQVMVGYWARPNETSDVIKGGWLYTGDMGYMDTCGYLYIHDRKRDMIITGGENVYPAEIENLLYEHPAVADVAVFGVPDEQWGEAVKAVVVVKQGAQVTADELIAFAKGKVAGFKVPKSVDFADNLPRNTTGKVLRRLVREPYWKSQGRDVA
ncbi:long-chain-fatty-acid--CoA ligase [Pseudomonas sp. C11]|uniref:long-chain-fatty-acid--CoA ligase n=1 Tax=Pseudomonas sp. C11 TaxID=3075550 RepID=UPI002AFF8D63|nr:long-chain-fatty-acid--CoA ligase [Pseudomonas sp. C11]